MPREVVTKTVVYQFDELSPEAQRRAIQIIREKRAGEWWDSADEERIKEAMVYELAGRLGAPGRDKYEEADFPGIPGLKVLHWSAYDHEGRSFLMMTGLATRGNAPDLAWTDSILAGRMNLDDATSRLEHSDAPDDAADKAWWDSWNTAVRYAIEAGIREYEYMTGEECARDDAAGREFTADGKLYIGPSKITQSKGG